MLHTLTNIYLHKNFVALYTDLSNSSQFIFGRIANINKDEIAIYAISPEGYFDGVVAKKTTDILRVDLGGRYMNKMKQLMAIHHVEIPDYELDNKDIFRSLLTLAKDSREIVSLELLESGYVDVTGFVINLENDVCAIKQVDPFGNEDGISFINKNDISQISYSSSDEVTLYELWEANGYG